MSKIKNYERTLYESILIGLHEVMKPYRQKRKEEILFCFYTKDAYEQAVLFLCLNDIQHTFTIGPANAKLHARVVMVSWIEDDGSENSFAWWEENNGKD